MPITSSPMLRDRLLADFDADIPGEYTKGRRSCSVDPTMYVPGGFLRPSSGAGVSHHGRVAHQVERVHDSLGGVRAALEAPVLHGRRDTRLDLLAADA